MGKLHETKVYSRTLIKGISTLAVLLVISSGQFFKIDKIRTSKKGPKNKKTHENS